MKPTNTAIDQAIDQLADALAAGHSDRLRAYLTVLGRFHRYSLTNQILITAQRPDATRVAGYRTWRKLGRQVRRGERGIRILAPVVKRIDGRGEPQASQSPDAHTAAEPDERGDDVTGRADETPRRVVGFRVVHVFDVAQTTGKPLPQLAEAAGDPGDRTDRLTRWLTGRGVTVQTQPLRPGLSGVSAGGHIRISEGLPPAQHLSVLVHEAAHELLHHQPGGPRPAKTIRELEAEAVAFAVCQSIGVEVADASRDYIQLYGGDRKQLLRSLTRIRATAVVLFEALGGRRPSSPSREEVRRVEMAGHR